MSGRRTKRNFGIWLPPGASRHPSCSGGKPRFVHTVIDRAYKKARRCNILSERHYEKHLHAPNSPVYRRSFIGSGESICTATAVPVTPLIKENATVKISDTFM
jgi:hypothetical protein